MFSEFFCEFLLRISFVVLRCGLSSCIYFVDYNCGWSLLGGCGDSCFCPLLLEYTIRYAVFVDLIEFEIRM